MWVWHLTWIPPPRSSNRNLKRYTIQKNQFCWIKIHRRIKILIFECYELKSQNAILRCLTWELFSLSIELKAGNWTMGFSSFCPLLSQEFIILNIKKNMKENRKQGGKTKTTKWGVPSDFRGHFPDIPKFDGLIFPIRDKVTAITATVNESDAF